MPANAQKNGKSMRSGADSVLLSQSREGDYMVRKYLVKHNSQDNSDFTVRYRINLSTISPNLDGNNRELADLKLFMDSLANDPMLHLNAIEIAGYASPDGSEESNRKLAYARAEALKEYLESNYKISSRYAVKLDGVVESWEACEKDLAKSGIAERDKALAVIRSRSSQSEKQRALKSMNSVWNYLKNNVLPKLRYAEVEFAYNRDRVVETRTLERLPQPAVQPVAEAERCCCCGAEIFETEAVTKDRTNGLIVEMGEVDIDW